MGTPKLSSPRVTVIREGIEEPLEIQTTNIDLVRWDKTRVKHHWPPMNEAPFLWLTFIAWSAARRTGAITDAVTYEIWESTVIDVDGDTAKTATTAESGDDLGNPFLKAVAPG